MWEWNEMGKDVQSTLHIILFVYSAFVPPLPPPLVLLFFYMSPPFLYVLYFPNETAFFFFTCNDTHSGTFSVVLYSYQLDSMLKESHSHVFQVSLHSSAAPVCHILFVPQKNLLYHQGNLTFLGNWGHLNWQECSNYLNLGSVLPEMAHAESFSCHKAALFICTAFISGWGLVPNSHSLSIWWLKREQSFQQKLHMHPSKL